MPLATPTYEQYPTPQNKKPSGGGGRTRPPIGTDNSGPRPTRQPRPVLGQPAPKDTPRPDREPRNPNNRFPKMPDDYGDGMPGVNPTTGLTYDQLMSLDFTGAEPSYVPPEWRAEQDYYKRIAQDQAAADSRNSYTDSLIDQYGAWSDSQSDALTARYDLGVGNMTALYDLNKNVLDQGLATDLGLLDERQLRDVGLPRELLEGKQRDLSEYFDILNQRRGIRRDQFVNDRDYFNALNGLLGRSRGNAYDRFQSNDQYLAGVAQDNQAQYGFATRDFRNDLAGARLQRDTSRRAASSDAASRGAFGSAGFRDNISDILSQFGLNTDAANLALDRANQQIGERDRSIGNERSNLRFGYEDQTIGFDRDAAGLTRSAASNFNAYRDDLQGFRKQEVDLNAQGRELENTNKALDSLAREYGIKRTDIENQFNNAVTRLGLDADQTRQDLEQMLNSGNAELVARGIEFMNQMMVFQDGSIPTIAPAGNAGSLVR